VSSARIRSFFDPATSTVTHVLADTATRRAAVIDSVLDYDPRSGRTSTASADAVIAWVRAQGLEVDWLLETHAHADHLSAAPHLKQQLGGRVAIGAHICAVQAVFRGIFNAADMAVDGSPFEHLFADGEHFHVGSLELEVLHTPGHTPGSCCFVLQGAGSQVVFAGDTLFAGSIGRTDLWGGDTDLILRSLHGKLLSLDDDTQVVAGHGPGTTIGRERRGNPFLTGAGGPGGLRFG
jgi:glyoxylase-like metal-dependent hydrolase (beta-lactamase superfamily II)